MSTAYIPVLEGLMIVAIVFGFGFYEIYKLRKERLERENLQNKKPEDS